MTATVRSAVRGDMQRIQEIAAQNGAAAQWTDEHYEILLAEPAEHHILLVSEDDAQVQGFLVGRLAGDQWEIENIAIAPSEQREGKGSQLLREFLCRARHSGTAVFLEVRESNVAARNFYKQMGFTEAGRRKSYYQSPQEDALVLQLSF